MLNRIKCFVLALIFLISTISSAASAALPEGDSVYRETLCEKLVSLGIDKAGEIAGISEVSRGDFVALAVQLGNIVVESESPFLDVSSKDKNYPYIASAYELKYIYGAADGCFYPERAVTLGEAITIVVRMLGYETFVTASGKSYMVVADSIDLTDGVGGEYDLPLSGDMALQLAVNALHAYPLDFSEISNGSAELKKSDKLLLERSFGVKRAFGLVERNEFTDLYSANLSVSKDELMIDGDTYTCMYGNAADYLGIYCEFYYDTDSKEIVFIAPEIEENKIVESSTYDIAEITVEHAVLGDETELKFSPTVKLVYNGKAESITENRLKCDYGKYVFVDNDGDNRFDVIKLTSYSIIQVKAVSPLSCTIVGADDTSVVLDSSDTEASVVIKKDGADADISAITTDGVILYAESASGGRVLKQAEICSASVSGTINGIDDNGVYINNSYYLAPQSFLQTADLGLTGTAWIDCYGSCVAFKREVRMVYGYLRAVEKRNMEDVKCRIFTENNRWVTLPLKKTIKYNGAKNTDAEDVKTALGSTPAQIRQLIEYKVNDSGYIIEINTARSFAKMSAAEMNAIDENIFRLSAEGELKYTSNGHLLGNDIALTGETPIFSVPSSDSGDIEDNYSVASYTSLVADEDYDVKVYNADRTRIAGVCVVYDMPNIISSEASLMIVKGLTEVYIDGDSYPAVRGYMNGEEIMFPLKGTSVLSSYSGTLNKNDIIRVAFDKNGLVTKVSRIYNAGSGLNQMFVSGTFGNKSATVAGRVVSCDYTAKKCLVQYSDGSYVIVTLKSGNGSVYILNANSRNPVVSGTNEDILKDDYIMCTTRYSNVQELIILRD